jgi:hypothetical protein
VVETFTSWEIALLSWIRETCLSAGKISPMLEAEVVYPLFPYEN